MRTRSQPLSPGGFLSLEKEQNAPRQTRSMRARSASHTSAQSNSQSETEEPQSQPVTRSRAQSTNKKTTTAKTMTSKTTTTTKKATTAKKSATTKRAAAARKTDTTAKPSSKPTKAPATRAMRTRAERKTTRMTEAQSPEESQEDPDASESPEAAEADTTATESPKIPDGNNEEGQKSTEATSSAVDVLSEPKTSDLNRKRPRTDSPERASETPSIKRSRTLRPPGSTSLARRLAPLSRRLSTSGVPYAERLRRRQAERQGRIHTTVFRLPELVAQTEADRRASESASPSPCPPAPHNSFDFPESSDLSRSMEESSVPPEPRTPETPRGWNIRGLLSSVPRSVSRFLPRLGRSFGRTEEGEEIDPEAASGQSTPSVPSTPTTKTTSAPAHPPASERVLTTAESWRAPGGSTPKSVPAKKPLPNLSYDLFPRPINRDLYLPRAEPPAEAEDATKDREADKEQQQRQEQAQNQVSEGAVAAAEDRGRQTDTTDKKRKRDPSPDVIPNPPGCSYGLDLDYFCYSDSDEEEEPDKESPSISKPTPLAKSAVRSALRSERHPSKKVRFDASPEDTPSKKRGRATDPYQGHHFLGLGDVSPTPAADSAKPPSTATGSPVQRAPGFKFNTQGSFGFDYDDFSDDSTSSGASTPASLSPSSSLPETRTTPRSQVQESLQSPRPTSRAAPSAPPSTPVAKVDAEALAKVRSQAEKYKPKTPSGLRTASRYSTSPMVQSPDVELPKEPEPAQKPLPEQHLPEKENVPEKPSEKQAAERFGDDQFARDAEWLYERCPSGDLSKFAWPEKRGLVDSLEINPEAVKILDDVWDDADIEVGHSAFCRGMEEFAATLV